MSDLSDARSRLRDHLASSGVRGMEAERKIEASVRRVSEKINRGENPAPTDDAKARAAIKQRRKEQNE